MGVVFIIESIDLCLFSRVGNILKYVCFKSWLNKSKSVDFRSHMCLLVNREKMTRDGLIFEYVSGCYSIHPLPPKDWRFRTLNLILASVLISRYWGFNFSVSPYWCLYWTLAPVLSFVWIMSTPVLAYVYMSLVGPYLSIRSFPLWRQSFVYYVWSKEITVLTVFNTVHYMMRIEMWMDLRVRKAFSFSNERISSCVFCF